MADFAKLLSERGHEVVVLTSDLVDLETNCDLGSVSTKVIRSLLLKGKWSPGKVMSEEPIQRHAYINQKNSYTLIQILTEFKPDICLAGNIDLLGLEVLQIVMASGVPVAHYVMNKTPGFAPVLTPPDSMYRCITCSDWVRQSLRQDGYSIESAIVLYPGAIIEEFYQEDLPKQDHLKIAYASLVMPYKGADVLVEALSLLNAAGVKFEATIAGGSLMPDFVTELEKFVQSEEMQDRIKFPGVLSRQGLKELFKSHNILVFPSRFDEPFGISQIEAMAAGLTLVTSGTGGAAEIIDDGKDGLIFGREDPLNLAETLASLASDIDRWGDITKKGQVKAITKFNQEKSVEQLENILLGMLN